ncbi:MAG: glycerol kinase GlpK [Betaproteobacteria bacterium]|nr:glycerol kinase GlpK [Betaproteobacteria bacterium]MDH5350574.1 glycerol kinase GlpK [Betaproteobacteria bacterium]
MKYILALDQGTTSSRAIVFDERGTPVASAQREFRQVYPQPGWVEHDPREILATQREVARAALAQSGVALADLLAIGITNQRETTLVWDRQSGEPVANAIVWQDRRTAQECRVLKEAGAEGLVRERTGLVIDPYFSATKIAWLLDQVPGARARAERGELAFGTVDTWLVWHLTGNRTHVTDVSNAARTMLYNVHAHDWDEELLRLFRVPRALLPDVHPSAHAFGMTPKSLFGEPLIIGGVAGDQQAAMFGQACHAPGMAKNTYGTGCFMLLHTGGDMVQSAHGLVSTPCAHLRDKEFALEGSVFVGGAVVQWLRDELGFFQSSAEIEALANSVLDSGGVCIVPAFTGLGAPHWDPEARGAIFGLTRGTSRAHIARAALESIAFQSAEVLEAMQKDSGMSLKELRVDGGATANDLLMQFQADLLGVPVVRPRVLETTALGAAYLAGLTVDLWKSRDEIAAQWQADKRFEPRMEAGRRDEMMARWREAVQRSLRWPAGS